MEETDGAAILAQEILDGELQAIGRDHDHSGGDGAQIDHGGTAGLLDNDHTQYLLTVLNPAAGGADHTVSGLTNILTAGETVTFGDVCSLKVDDSEMYLAGGSAITTMPVTAMALATIADAATGSFLKIGYVRDDTWTWTIAGLIFVAITGTTGNTLTQTAPSATGEQVQLVGYAFSADVMYFQPNLMLVEIV